MNRRAAALAILFASTLVGCDLGTKEVARRGLVGSPIRVVDGLFDLRYTENRDVAFSALRLIPESVRRPLVLSLQAAVAAAIVFLLARRKFQGTLEQLGLLLVLGGAVGNLVDRGLRGYVVDFLHLHGWPIFNLADVYIVVGVGLLVVQGLRRGPPRDATG